MLLCELTTLWLVTSFQNMLHKVKECKLILKIWLSLENSDVLLRQMWWWWFSFGLMAVCGLERISRLVPQDLIPRWKRGFSLHSDVCTCWSAFHLNYKECRVTVWRNISHLNTPPSAHSLSSLSPNTLSLKCKTCKWGYSYTAAHNHQCLCVVSWVKNESERK